MSVNTHKTSKRILSLSLAVAVSATLLFALLSGGDSDSAQAQTGDTPTPTPEQNDQALDRAAALEGKLKASQYPNMDSNLNQIVEQAQTGQFTAQAAAANAPVHSGASVGVTLYITESYAQEIWNWLDESGASPRNIGVDYIEAYVPVSLLAEASRQEGVVSVRTIVPPGPAQGTVVSEGSAGHGAPAWHAAGYKGQRFNIGVIDHGFEGIQSLLGTELPSSVNVRCYRSRFSTFNTDDIADCETGGKHGTAVTEAIFDVAPEATFYIAHVISKGDVSDAVDWMISQNVDVINMSIYWSWDGPGDGTALFSDSPLRSVDKAVQNGIVWASAAGNTAPGAWYGTYSNPDSDRFHNFSGNDECNSVYIESGETFTAQIRWDDSWGGATQDLDLWLVDPPADGHFDFFDTVSWSFDDQSGQNSDIPFEILTYTPVIGGTYCLAIPTPPFFEGQITASWVQLQTWGGRDLEYAIVSRSITNPAESANAGMLAVGASLWSNTSTIEPFSGRGPTNDGRIKPDIVGADGGQSVTYRSSDRPDGDWYGTSQASSHIAGMAVLVKQRFPNYSPQQVTQYLKANAEARGAVPNNTWGYGFAKLPAPAATTPTPEPTATSEPTPGPTGTPQPTPDPSATAEPTPEPTATPEPTPQPTATPEPTPPPSSDYNIEDHACNADDLAHLDGYTLDSTFGPESYEANYTGVIGYYRSRFVADNGPTIVCLGTQYDRVANARWDSLNYSTVLQYAATAVDEIFDHEQAFVSSYIGEDTLGLLLDYEIDDSSFKSSEVIFLDAATLTVTTVRAIQSDSDDYPDISTADGIAKNIAARIIPDDTATQSSSSLLKLFGWLD